MPAPRANHHSQLQLTIEAFAASMEFNAAPEMAADGSYTFAFESSGVLSILPASDGREIVMALGRKPISDNETFLRRFLLSASLESYTSGPLHAGMTAAGLFCFATRIPIDRFDLPTLEANLNQLMAAHDSVG